MCVVPVPPEPPAPPPPPESERVVCGLSQVLDGMLAQYGAVESCEQGQNSCFFFFFCNPAVACEVRQLVCV